MDCARVFHAEKKLGHIVMCQFQMGRQLYFLYKKAFLGELGLRDRSSLHQKKKKKKKKEQKQKNKQKKKNEKKKKKRQTWK